MKFIHKKRKGFTLIEVVLYAILLSFLMAGYVQYAYFLHKQDAELLNNIYDVQTN